LALYQKSGNLSYSTYIGAGTKLSCLALDNGILDLCIAPCYMSICLFWLTVCMD